MKKVTVNVIYHLFVFYEEVPAPIIKEDSEYPPWLKSVAGKVCAL